MASPAATVSSGPSAAAAAPSTALVGAGQVELLPSPTALLQAARLAKQQEKPIQMDYYEDTAQNRAFIGEDSDTKEKILVKSKEEFTSIISKMYKVGDDFLITTENSIYIVSGKIQKRKVNMASLQGDV